MKLRTVVLAGLLLAVVLPAMAGDIVSMPTGNMVGKGKVEVNYIHWNLGSGVGRPGTTDIGEVFVGVTDRLELDVDTLHMKDGFPTVASVGGRPPTGFKKNVTEVNAYYQLINESPEHPSLILGATNITGATFLPSSERPYGDDRVAPFALGAYNVQVPEAEPKWSDPLIRVHAGYGIRAHEKHWFGGFQFLFTPKIGAAWLNYTGAPAYMGVYMPNPRWAIRGGFFRGRPFGSLGWYGSF